MNQERGQRQRIVVGVDGSDGGRAALRWAVEEAELRHATVEVVLAWDMPYTFGDPMMMLPFDLAEEASHARQQLEDLVTDEVRGQHQGLEVNRIVAQGPAAEILLHMAKGADLLVLGSRGLGGFKGLLLGSVSQQCVQHAPSPVVVIPS